MNETKVFKRVYCEFTSLHTIRTALQSASRTAVKAYCCATDSDMQVILAHRRAQQLDLGVRQRLPRCQTGQGWNESCASNLERSHTYLILARALALALSVAVWRTWLNGMHLRDASKGLRADTS